LRAVSIGIQKAIDELYRTREERKILQTKEEQLSDSIKEHMLREGLEEIETKEHCASLSIRSSGSIDPEAYYEALDEDVDKLLATVSVRKESNKKKDTVGADYYLSKEEIESITEPVDISALRITKIAELPKQKAAPKLKARFA
jgi:hypothetical protein